MSLNSMLTKTVQFTYKVQIGMDQYNQPVFDAVTQDVQCYYRFLSSGVVDSTFLENAEVQIIIHAGTQTEGLGIVTIDGIEYIPSGVPEHEYNPRTGLISHTSLNVRRGES